MKDNRFSMLCVAGVVVGTVYATAGATLPDDQSIRYNIRETPSDPGSKVIFTITLELTADQQDGDSIGWQINEIQFVRMSDKAEWIEQFATSPLSLWWVDHADHYSPKLAEFAMSPLLAGTADAVNPSDPDLDYKFKGVECDPVCQGMYGGDVGALDVLLWVLGAAEPDVDDDDEPVEVDPGGDPI